MDTRQTMEASMKTFKQFILESMHGDKWAGTSWTDTKDGKELTVTLHQLLDYSSKLPTKEMDTYKLKDISLHTGKTDPEILKNIEKANLNFPILIIKKLDGSINVIDGNHRLQKAINNNLPKIKAKLINVKDLPKDWQWILR